jgi:peptidyl-prolyl cis-trans isomerase SurA
MRRLLPSPFCRHLLAAGLFVVFCAVATLGAEIIERVLVKVNGEVFTKTELEARQVAAIRAQNPQVTEADLKRQVEVVTPQILVDTIDEMLLLQRGKELGIAINDTQFAEILTRLKKENKIETDEQFQQALRQEGLTVVELRKQIERRSIIEKVEFDEIFSHVQVNEAEARKYYEEHKNEFTNEPEFKLREVFVKVPTDAMGVNVAAEEEAKQKAESIRARALKGEPFEKLTELSDAPSKGNGGLVGPVKRSELDAAFVKVLEGMKVGDISAPIRTPTGFDIIKLESATPTRLLPFEEARDQIARRVGVGKQQAEFDNYLRKLRASAIIDWKVPELKKVYEDQLARLRTAQPAGMPQ